MGRWTSKMTYQIVDWLMTYIECFVMLVVVTESGGRKFEEKKQAYLLLSFSLFNAILVAVCNQISAFSFITPVLSILYLSLKSTRHFPACSHNFPKAGDARFQGRSRLFCLLGKFPYLDESRRILMAVSSKTSSKTRFTTQRRVASPPQPCSRPYGRSTRASS